MSSIEVMIWTSLTVHTLADGVSVHNLYFKPQITGVLVYCVEQYARLFTVKGQPWFVGDKGAGAISGGLLLSFL